MKKSQFIVLSSAVVLLGSPLLMAEPCAEDSVTCELAVEHCEAAPEDEVPGDSGDEAIVRIMPVGDWYDETVDAEEGESDFPGEEGAEESFPGDPGEEGAEESELMPGDDCVYTIQPFFGEGREVELENSELALTSMGDGLQALAASKADAELGQDDKATVIEGGGPSAAKVTHVKKGPLALVKQGRVFLR